MPEAISHIHIHVPDAKAFIASNTHDSVAREMARSIGIRDSHLTVNFTKYDAGRTVEMRVRAKPKWFPEGAWRALLLWLKETPNA